MSDTVISNSLAILAPFLIYFFGVLSPGPANLAIAQIALENGRSKSVVFSVGVVTGSIIWGITTFTGLVQIMNQFPLSIRILGFLGAIYMSWLGYANIHKFISGMQNKSSDSRFKTRSNANYFIRGLMIHLTNPKAFLVWTTILVSALDIDKGVKLPPHIILIICGLLGIIVFCGYAVLFSNKGLVLIYENYSRFIHLIIGVIFFMVAMQLFLITLSGSL